MNMVIKSFSTFIENTHDRGVVITWGRFNPPTRGHELVFNKAANIANKFKYNLRILTTHTQDSKKNPLTYKEKIRFLKSLFPRYKDYVVDDHEENITTIIDAARILSKTYEHLILVVGQDRVEEFNRILKKYNEDNKFKSINVISAGIRDPESEDIKGVSASDMRDAARSGNKSKFVKGLPKRTSRKAANLLYKIVRSRLGTVKPVEEKIEFSRSPIRERFFAGKAFMPGDTVIIKNTNKPGVVKSLGSNYVIVIESKTNKLSRHWPDNLVRT